MKKQLFILLLVLISFCIFNTVLATPPSAVPNSGQSTGAQTTGPVELDNPLGVENVQDLIGQVINAILGVVGSLALLMFVYGGLTWMTAAGNEEKIKKGKGILMWATIGLVVIFTSYAVLRFIISVLQGS